MRYLKKPAWSASFRLEKFEEKLEIVIKLFEAKNLKERLGRKIEDFSME